MPKGASFHCEISIKFWFGRLIKYDIYHIIVWRSMCIGRATMFSCRQYPIKKQLPHTFSSHQHTFGYVKRTSLALTCTQPIACSYMYAEPTHQNPLYSKFYWTKNHRVRQHCDHTQDLRIFCKENSRRRFMVVFFIKVLVFYYRISELFFWNFIVKFNRTLLEYFSIFRLKFNQLPNQTSNNCNIFATKFT